MIGVLLGFLTCNGVKKIKAVNKSHEVDRKIKEMNAQGRGGIWSNGKRIPLG